MIDKKIIIDNNGIKEEYIAFYYDGEYKTFKNIFIRCAPRIKLLLRNNIKQFNAIQDSLYFDDGWYEFTTKSIRDIWNCDTSEKAFLKLSKMNCSYRRAKVDDVNKHYSGYLPFPFKLNEYTPIAMDAVRDGDYILIKVAKDLQKDAGCIFSCNGFFVDSVCVEEYDECKKELPKNEN